MQTIASALKNARITSYLTQRQVADALGITPQFVSDIENGRRDLTEKYIELLPETMRHVVRQAFIAQHQSAIERLNGQ